MSYDLSTNYFEIFALPRSYSVDRAMLDERYRKLQQTVHPDRFATATDQERRISMQQTALINEAYETLKDPVLRGRYLLELDGHVFEDNRSMTGDPAFLMEQIELREALAEVRGGPSPLEALGRQLELITSRFSALDDELSSWFAQPDRSFPDVAVGIIHKMQFYRRLEQEALELEFDLEDQTGLV